MAKRAFEVSSVFGVFMGKVISLDEFKRLKERGESIQKLLKIAMEAAENGNEELLLAMEDELEELLELELELNLIKDKDE
jgi:hypothetical protein